MGVSAVAFGVFCLFCVVKSQEKCNGELWCEQGHCCGSDGTHCCTYYYELWWFWMIWGLIIMLSCCCLYQQHRLKKRQRRALRVLQRSHQDGVFVGIPAFGADGRISSTYNESYAGSELRLPTYDEVQDLPKDPPAYELLFEAGEDEQRALPHTSDAAVAEHQVSLQSQCDVDTSSSMVDARDDVGLLDNEALQEEDLPPAYTTVTASLSSSPSMA